MAQLRYTEAMKTTTIPSIRVEPDFRAEVEAVLAEGETLSQFVEASVRASVERRRMQAVVGTSSHLHQIQHHDDKSNYGEDRPPRLVHGYPYEEFDNPVDVGSVGL